MSDETELGSPRFASAENLAAVEDAMSELHDDEKHSGEILTFSSEGPFQLDDGTGWEAAGIDLAVASPARLSGEHDPETEPADPLPGDFRVIDCNVTAMEAWQVVEGASDATERILESDSVSEEGKSHASNVVDAAIAAAESASLYKSVFVQCRGWIMQLTEVPEAGAVYEMEVGRVGAAMLTALTLEDMTSIPGAQEASDRMVKQLARAIREGGGGGQIFHRFDEAK